MEAWRTALRGDPLPWLLDRETPAIRHLTRESSSYATTTVMAGGVCPVAASKRVKRSWRPQEGSA